MGEPIEEVVTRLATGAGAAEDWVESLRDLQRSHGAAALETAIQSLSRTQTLQPEQFVALSEAMTLLNEAVPAPKHAATKVTPASYGEDQAPERLRTDRDAPSTIAGRYELIKEIGRGGMGVVYRAPDRRRAEMEDRNPYIALKLLHPEFKDHPLAMMTLQREASKTQSLAHPNIITVYDFDRDGDLAFITMELLEGRSLAQVIAETALHGGMSWSAIEPVIKQVIAGLAYAHSRGIVHADLKPGNVFVDEAGRAKILDFGIARAQRDKQPGEAVQTRLDLSQLAALSEPYASPEMLAGETPVAADDIFAVGLLLAEMASGKHPFDCKNAMQAHTLDLRPQLPTKLPRDIRRWIEGMLRWKRQDRPKDGSQLQGFLDARASRSSWLLPGIAASVLFISLASALFIWGLPSSISDAMNTEAVNATQAPADSRAAVIERTDPPAESEPPQASNEIAPADLRNMSAVERSRRCNLWDDSWFDYSCSTRQACYHLLSSDHTENAEILSGWAEEEERLAAKVYGGLAEADCTMLPGLEQQAITRLQPAG